MLEVILFDTAMPLMSLRGSDGSSWGCTGVKVCFNLLLFSAANEFKVIESAICDSSSAAEFGLLTILKLFGGIGSSHNSSSSPWAGIGDNRPPRLLTVEAFDEVRGLAKLSPSGKGNGDSVSGIVSKESELELLVGETFPGELARFASRARLTDRRGLEGESLSSSLIFSFLDRPRFFSDFGAESSEPERRRLVLPPLASGLSIHHELLPLPSFWTLTNLLWRDKLWRIEFCKEKRDEKNHC